MDLAFYDRKKILITGSNGFIGRHIVSALTNSNAILYLMDIKSLEKGMSNEKNVNFVCIDLLDKEKLKNVIKEIDPDIIFHLAADILRSQKLEDADRILKVNVNGTINLLSALESINFDSFVFTSTSEVYGSDNISPFIETMLPDPVSLYSFSKLTAENFCKFYAKKFNKPLTILRLFNVYGEGQNSDMFIPQILESCFNGNSFKMTKGKQTRDFIYIDDVVSAFFKAATYKEMRAEIFNIGSGKSHSMSHIAKLIASEFSKSEILEFGALNYRENEIWKSEANITKSAQVLNWKPKFSLNSGIKKVVKFYLSNKIE